jgi:hypothetical protein
VAYLSLGLVTHPVHWCYVTVQCSPVRPCALVLQVGKPIKVQKMDYDKITEKDIDAVHDTFVKEMSRLFERTKAKHGVGEKTTLQIL